MKAHAARTIEVFNEAKALPPGPERERFLTESCGEDQQLRTEVSSLLDADSSAESFMEDGAGSSTGTVKIEGPGDRVGRYQLLEKIGEGGCGIVYLAEQESPVRRRVALKIIKLGMDTRQAVARFEAERQALALMDHPNIAKVFDGGSTDLGRPYFVMELVRGTRITDYCEEARLPIRARLHLFVQVCDAVQHAHQKGIIHRDLKPSNILVTISGGAPFPKVIDFGIAKATGQRLIAETFFTHIHAFIGTPAYTSPEQAQMSSVDVDTRSDIYSLGVLLYELLTGRTPFDSVQLLSAGLDEMRRIIRTEEPLKPSTQLTRETERSGKVQVFPIGSIQSSDKQPGRGEWSPSFLPAKERINSVRGDLDWIVMKCLEKDRSRRYETASGLAADIQRHLDRQPIAARPSSGMYLAQKFARRHRGALIAAIAVFVALVVAVVALWTSNVRIRLERNGKDAALRSRGAALDAARASEQRAREQLFVSLQNQAQARRNSRQIGQRTESLAALAEAARIRPTPDLRDDAIAAMAVPDIEEGPTWRVEDRGSTDFTVDSRYRRYARLGSDGTVDIREIQDNRGVHKLESDPSTTNGSAGGQLFFSPDGRFIARMAETGKLWVWQLESGKRVLNNPSVRYTGALDFSPDSRRLAVGHEDSIILFDLNTGLQCGRWQVPARVQRIEFDADGSRVAVSYSGNNIISVFRADEGTHLTDLPMGSSSSTAMAWSPDGSLLATAGSDPRIRIWDVRARRQLAMLEGHVQQVNFLRFHWSGELLVSGSWDNVFRLWQPSPGRLLMKIPARSMGVSRRGEWSGVIWRDRQKMQPWGIVPSGEYHTFANRFAEGESELWEGDVSPNGAILALATSDGVRLWDISQGREICWLSIGPTTCAKFRATGRELLTCGPGGGLQRWQVPDYNGAGELKMGPAHTVALPFTPRRMAGSRDDERVAVVGEAAGESVIIDLLTERARPEIMRHPSAGFIAISPNTDRIATSGWHSKTVKLWDGKNGTLIMRHRGRIGCAATN